MIRDTKIKTQIQQSSAVKSDGAKTYAVPSSNGKTKASESLNPFDNRRDYILHLQRTIGNRAVISLLQNKNFQAKLNIGPPGDQYEQEADQTADKVVSMKADEEEAGAISRKPQNTLAGSITPLQREAKKEEEELRQKPEEDEMQQAPEDEKEMMQAPKDEDELQQKPEDDEDKLQKRNAGRSFLRRKEGSQQAPDNVETAIFAAKGSGKPLSPGERNYYEPRFGADFSSVKLHTGASANHLAKSVNAKAFTVGNDIFFAGGQYNAQTQDGKKLMAHELTHTVQQGGSVQKKLNKE